MCESSRFNFSFLSVLVVSNLLGAAVLAQDKAVTLDDLVSSAEQWAQENLDDDALRALQQVDREKARKVLADFQKQFRGEYVIDLASLKDAAIAIIPLLERYEETL